MSFNPAYHGSTLYRAHAQMTSPFRAKLPAPQRILFFTIL